MKRLFAIIWIICLIGSASMVGGCYLSDRAIDAHPARALAHVTHVDAKRTVVSFQTTDGELRSPPDVLYPTGLSEGQRVWVTYNQKDPDQVRVEGRRWTLSIIPALSVAAWSTVLCGVLGWGYVMLKKRKRHQKFS